MKRPWSLLRRLVLSFGSALALLIFVSYFFLYYLLLHGFEHERYMLLQDRMEAVSALLNTENNEEMHRRVEQEWPSRDGEKVFIQVSDTQGRLITQTPNIPAAVFDNHERYLVSTKKMNDALIVAAIGNTQGQEFLARIRETMLAVLLLTVMNGMLLVWFIVRKGIRPLEAIARTVGTLGASNLHARVDPKEFPTELNAVALSLNQSLERLEDAFARLSRFSSDIAHELRTPLTSIMGEIELALTNPSKSALDTADILHSFLEECKRLTHIIDSLLFLARAENLRRDLRLEPICLQEKIKEIVDFYEVSAQEKGINLSFQQPEKDIQIRLEDILFQRALGNLVSNAIQFTASGGEILIKLQREEEFARIDIIDNGVGISSEQLPHIFDRFYRANDEKGSGFGLGLAITKSIIDLHAGTIFVCSELGRGTTFTLKMLLS